MNEKESKAHLLVLLGNGFDLAFDLKTSYSHFMEHLLEETISSGTLGKHPYTSTYFKRDKHGNIDPYITMKKDSVLWEETIVIGV